MTLVASRTSGGSGKCRVFAGLTILPTDFQKLFLDFFAAIDFVRRGSVFIEIRTLSKFIILGWQNDVKVTARFGGDFLSVPLPQSVFQSEIESTSSIYCSKAAANFLCVESKSLIGTYRPVLSPRLTTRSIAVRGASGYSNNPYFVAL